MMGLFDCACVQRNGHRDREDPQDVERTTPCRQTWSKRLREETDPDCRDAHLTLTAPEDSPGRSKIGA